MLEDDDADKRRVLRLEGEMHTEVVLEGAHYKGITINLSINGVLLKVEGEEPSPIYMDKLGTIYLDLVDEYLSMNCRVTRVKGDELAVSFTHDNFESIIKLKTFMEV